jgi:DNA-binding NarL/FixJ family response regulator
MSRRVQILVADDHVTFRVGMVSLLASRPEWEVYAQVSDGEEAVQIAKKACPDLAILDISMPRKNGLEAAREMLEYCPSTIIIGQSLHDEKALIVLLREIGVKGFVYKLRIERDLIPTVEAVLKGETRFFGAPLPYSEPASAAVRQKD